MTDWVRTFERGTDFVESLNGVMWAEARLPFWWHHCQAQTRASFNSGYIERCACGASRLTPDGPWLERNQTRRRRRRARRDANLPRVQVICGDCGLSYEAAEGTPRAGQRLCDNCWADQLTAGREWPE